MRYVSFALFDFAQHSAKLPVVKALHIPVWVWFDVEWHTNAEQPLAIDCYVIVVILAGADHTAVGREILGDVSCKVTVHCAKKCDKRSVKE